MNKNQDFGAWIDTILMVIASDDALRIYALAGLAIVLILSLRLAWKARWQITGIPTRTAATEKGQANIREQLTLLRNGKDVPLTSLVGVILFGLVIPSLLLLLVLHFAPWLAGDAAPGTATEVSLSNTAEFVLSQFAMGTNGPPSNGILDGIVLGYRYLIGAFAVMFLHVLYVLIRSAARRDGLITAYKRLLGEPDVEEVVLAEPELSAEPVEAAHQDAHDPVEQGHENQVQPDEHGHDGGDHGQGENVDHAVQEDHVVQEDHGHGDEPANDQDQPKVHHH